MTPSDWRIQRLGDVAEIAGGGTPPTGDARNFGGDVPWITPRDLSSFRGRYILAGERTLSATGLRNSSARLLPQGAVVLSSRAPIGLVAIAGRPLATNQGCRSLILKDGHVPEFFFYLLRSIRERLEARAGGTTFKEISGSALAEMEVALPAPPEQRAIAAVLGSLDDKIEANRRMARTLQELARAIFKSWFVDFDPVRAKVEGRRPLVPPELEDLFPSKLVDSPIGPIPEGWEVARLGEHVEVVRGLSYRGADLVEEGEGLPLHNLNSVREGGGYKYEGIKWYAGDYKDRHLVEPGDVIVANTEQGHDYLLIGYPAIVPRTFGEESLFSADLFRVRPSEGSSVSCTFLYHALRAPRLRGAVVGYTGGTTVNHLSVEGLRRPTCVVPPSDLTSAFDRLVRPMLDLEEQLVDESRTLARLRDWLLPKLISGQVRVAAESSVRG